MGALERLAGAPEPSPMERLGGRGNAAAAVSDRQPAAEYAAPNTPLARLAGQAPAPTPSAGPLDVRPAADAAMRWIGDIVPKGVQDVVGTVGGIFGKRLAAGSAAVMSGATRGVPGMPDLPSAGVASNPQTGQLELRPQDILPYWHGIEQGFIEGKAPPGLDPNAPDVDLLHRAGFEKPLVSSEKAEAINRRLLGLPLGSLARAGTSPEAAALLVQGEAGGPVLNAIGAAAAPLPIRAAKEVANLETRIPAAVAKVPIKAIAGLAGKEVRARAIPGVKETLEFFKPGSSLPNRYRDAVYSILRTREGQADFRGFLREKAMGKMQELPVDVQDRIATAIEKRAIPTLAPAERDVADKLVMEYQKQVSARTTTGLRAHELGAHIEPMRVKVIEALDHWTKKPKDTLRRFRVAQAAARLEKASGVKLSRSPVKLAFQIGDPKKFQGVAFTKRVLTKEMREAVGEKPYGTALEPGGLSTGRLPERMSDPKLTTEAINAATIQHQGFRAFEPVVQATLKSGAANDTRVMNAGIVIDAARRFGRPLARGEKALGDIYSVSTGFSDPVKRVLARTAVPKEVHEFLEKLNERLSPESYGKTNAFIREVNNQFKTWALFSPGFISRNVQNNIIQTAIYGNMDLRNWQVAGRLRMSLARAKSLADLQHIGVRIGKRTYSGAEYIESAIKRGVIGGGQSALETGSALTTTGPAKIKQAYTAVFRGARAANTFAEDVSRISFDLHNLRAGLSPMEAAQRVDHVLFKYSPRFQSKGFARLRRYGMPFANWTAQIVPLFFRTAMERPGSLGVVTNAMESANRAQGFEPKQMAQLGKDIAEQGGVVVSKDKDGNVRVVKPTGFGTMDVNPLLAPIAHLDAGAMVQELVNRGYPQINVPAALFSGKDPLTGADLTGKPVPGPAALKLLFLAPAGRAWARKHGIFEDPKNPGGVRVSDRVNVVLRSLPPLRLAGIVADILKPDKGAMRRVLSFGPGVSVVDRNPAQQRFYQMKDTKQGIGEAMSLLRRYPPEARASVARQFPPDVRRVLMARGIIQTEAPHE